ncbi:BEM_collapsed_G0058260.mRNA.1.CDS.1 [Saccharomyces cerevisiae]|nr:BEM_collapsed_G0058260.mRNA.1.CDS.1 [Saccharomyces cerevisiae]
MHHHAHAPHIHGLEGSFGHNSSPEKKCPKETPPPLRSSGINTIQINAARRNARSNAASLHPSVQPTAAPATPPRHICNNPNNPQCLHCGSVIIPSPGPRYPWRTTSISINDWTISSRKKPILNSQELDIWENENSKV